MAALLCSAHRPDLDDARLDSSASLITEAVICKQRFKPDESIISHLARLPAHLLPAPRCLCLLSHILITLALSVAHCLAR